MPSNYTQNYQLSQWEADDRVQRTDFNSDNAKIDAALAAHAATLAETPRLTVETYVGDGTFGDDHPCQWTFPRKPALVIISDDGLQPLHILPRDTQYTFDRYFLMKINWNGNTVSWSCIDATSQKNTANITYYVLTFYPTTP